MQANFPSGPRHQIHVGRVVKGADASTQFPTPVEDALDRPLKVKWARLQGLNRANPLFERLAELRNEVARLRRHLEVVQRWTLHPSNKKDVTHDHWRELELSVRAQLREKEDLFWELNVPDVEERARLRVLEGVNYQNQAEQRARAFSDFLIDSARFPRIRDLGKLPDRGQANKSTLESSKGPISERLGEPSSGTLTLTKESSGPGLTQSGPQKVQQDPQRGQESQVSSNSPGTQVS